MNYVGKTRIRVAMVSVHGDPLVPDEELGSDGKGGQNVYVREVGQHLSKLGCDVTWFTRSESPDQVGTVELSPTLRCRYVVVGKQCHINRDHLFKYLKDFIKAIKNDQEQFDVVFSNYWLSGYVGLNLALPQIHIHHSLGAVKYQSQVMPPIGPIRLKIEQQLNKLVNCMVQQSSVEADTNQATNPVLITPGISTEEFSKCNNKDKYTLQEALGFEKRVLNVLYVGRFSPQKGVPYLLKALSETTVNHTLRLIGNYADTPYEDLVSTYPRCKFLGPKPHETVIQYMLASDILIMPSMYEPFGMVAIEAMAAGCCLVVSATGGLDDIVKNGVNGFKVPLGDSDSIQQAFETLAGNRRMRMRISAHNRREAFELYGWEKTAMKLKKELNKMTKLRQISEM